MNPPAQALSRNSKRRIVRRHGSLPNTASFLRPGSGCFTFAVSPSGPAVAESLLATVPSPAFPVRCELVIPPKGDNLPEPAWPRQIVGRDTKNLDAAGVTRAAVETVAENTNDGVIAPLLFLLAGGAAFGVFYKAVNTMDSMIGYKNSRYLYFGRAAALLDDLINFIPARIAGLLIVIAAYFLQLDARNAWRVFLRDRYNHTSPNSAQTESACAGALHLRLGGSSEYRGIIVHKPYIGDSDRLPRPGDICLANRLLCVSSFICLLLGVAVKGAILWF